MSRLISVPVPPGNLNTRSLRLSTGDEPPDAERERAESIALLRSVTDASLWWIRQSSFIGRDSELNTKSYKVVSSLCILM